MSKRFISIAKSRLLKTRVRIGRIGGIPISLHWSWLPCMILLAVLDHGRYTSGIWRFIEFVGLFGIVLLHELGHALTARHLGLKAREIILWPLGGLAVTDAPRRWKKELLIVAAGPLVNVALTPLLFGIWYYYFKYFREGNISELLFSLLFANVGLLVFNLLPIWPLDGGRLMQSVLTGRFGIARSHLITSSVSFFVAVVGVGFFSLVGAFLGVGLLVALMLACVSSFNWARSVLRRERDSGLVRSAMCPECGSHPLDAVNQLCEHCGRGFNVFYDSGKCWNCGCVGTNVICYYCSAQSPFEKWFIAETRHENPPSIVST